MCEQKKQSDLLTILPQLKLDLESLKLKTLVEYQVYFFFEVAKPNSPLAKHILNELSKQASTNLATQQGRECGFADYDKPCTTKITSI